MDIASKPLTTMEDPQQELPPTWVTHLFLPISQNVVGGAAFSLIGMIGVIAYTGAADTTIDLYNAGVWCALAGGLVACIITVVRFFGDDLGIVLAAYRTGYQARDAEVSALHMEIRALRNDMNLDQAEGGAISAIHKRQEADARLKKNANVLIQVAFQGDSIARDAMKARGMGRYDWEAAVRVLRAAAVLNADGIIVATAARQAYKAVDELIVVDRQKGDKFVPSWQ